MEKLTVEASRLLGCIKLLNHDVHKALLDDKLDPSLAYTHRLGTAFYTNLTVSVCSLLTCMPPTLGRMGLDYWHVLNFWSLKVKMRPHRHNIVCIL